MWDPEDAHAREHFPGRVRGSLHFSKAPDLGESVSPTPCHHGRPRPHVSQAGSLGPAPLLWELRAPCQLPCPSVCLCPCVPGLRHPTWPRSRLPKAGTSGPGRRSLIQTQNGWARDQRPAQVGPSCRRSGAPGRSSPGLDPAPPGAASCLLRAVPRPFSMRGQNPAQGCVCTAGIRRGSPVLAPSW